MLTPPISGFFPDAMEARPPALPSSPGDGPARR